MDFLYITNEIFSSSQFVFRKDSSKLSITKLINAILQNLGTKQYVVSIFLNHKKAFDTLDHEIMLSKLKYYGIKGITNNWFPSYLTTRSQSTIIHEVTSQYGTSQQEFHRVPHSVLYYSFFVH